MDGGIQLQHRNHLFSRLKAVRQLDLRLLGHMIFFGNGIDPNIYLGNFLLMTLIYLALFANGKIDFICRASIFLEKKTFINIAELAIAKTATNATPGRP